MAWRLVWESVKMLIHLSFLYLSSATLMVTSSALIMECASSWPDASIQVVVAVVECITEAPIRGLPFLRDPVVYIDAVRLCRGFHSVGCGGDWGCVFVSDGV